MSVYKRPGSETYSYDFQLGGNRFSGDTGETEKRKAEKRQSEIKRQERARIEAAKGKTGANMTFGAAATRYMEEVGIHHAQADTTLSSLEWLEANIGKRTLISSIDNDKVALLVAKRRAEFRKVGSRNTPKRKVSPATVNRTCTEPLRKVLRRAADKWNAVVQAIDWTGHMLSEPKERVREASHGEEAAFMDELDRGYDTAVAFALLTGCRRMEIVGLVWQRVDFFNRQFTVIGKGGKSRTIPMSNAVFMLLWDEKDHDPVHVFTYVARRTRKIVHAQRQTSIVRGVRYPMTDAGLRTAMRRALDNAKVEGFRFHDLRHTAATRILRGSNLRVVQNLLGHSDPSTTARYAHALTDDIRAAMDAASPTKLPTDELEFRLNTLKKKG